jgi:hypothetical protein
MSTPDHMSVLVGEDALGLILPPAGASSHLARMLSLDSVMREVCRRRRMTLIGMEYDFDTDGVTAHVEYPGWTIAFSIYGDELTEHPCRRSRRRLLGARLDGIRQRNRILKQHLRAALR